MRVWFSLSYLVIKAFVGSAFGIEPGFDSKFVINLCLIHPQIRIAMLN